MKQRYTNVPYFAALFTLLFYLPTHSYSQCTCSNGNAPQTLVVQQSKLILPINDSTDFVLPQFDPSLGQLTCANVFSYISSVIRMRLENDEIYPLTYRINYSRTDRIMGPGLVPDLTSSFSKNYGPYNLAESDGNYFSGPDFVTVGPDSVLKNKNINRTISSGLATFLGYGTLTYNYKATGRTTVTGGVNYLFSVNSQDYVTVGITYSYCPAVLLASGMNNFTAQLKDATDVQLSWITPNETLGTKYEVEVSTNSVDFLRIGELRSQAPAGSTSSKYEFPYHLTQGYKGNLYFRVKQIPVSGNAIYSPIRNIAFENGKPSSLTVFPNPGKTTFQLQFGELLNGSYNVELMNLNGQIVYQRQIQLKDASQINLELTNAPVAGVYQVRAREAGSGRSYVSKLVIAQ